MMEPRTPLGRTPLPKRAVGRSAVRDTPIECSGRSRVRGGSGPPAIGGPPERGGSAIAGAMEGG